MRSGCLALAVVSERLWRRWQPARQPGHHHQHLGRCGAEAPFAYYQKCVNPILLELLPIAGTAVTNTCAAGGCHDVNTGSGGALRINPRAAEVVIGATPDAESLRCAAADRDVPQLPPAQAQVVFAGARRQPPHQQAPGARRAAWGGRVFRDENDPLGAHLIYWMSAPVPQGWTN